MFHYPILKGLHMGHFPGWLVKLEEPKALDWAALVAVFLGGDCSLIKDQQLLSSYVSFMDTCVCEQAYGMLVYVNIFPSQSKTASVQKWAHFCSGEVGRCVEDRGRVFRFSPNARPDGESPVHP